MRLRSCFGPVRLRTRSRLRSKRDVTYVREQRIDRLEQKLEEADGLRGEGAGGGVSCGSRPGPSSSVQEPPCCFQKAARRAQWAERRRREEGRFGIGIRGT